MNFETRFVLKAFVPLYLYNFTMQLQSLIDFSIFSSCKQVVKTLQPLEGYLPMIYSDFNRNK